MKFIILQGLPASGKTTWAREFVQKNKNYIRVNRDDLRNMRGEYWIPKQEKLISIVEECIVRLCLEDGKSVVLDATNLNDGRLQKWVDIAKDFGAKIEYKKFEVDVDECIKRDLKRANSVGRGVIMGMYEKYIKPETQEAYFPDKNLPRAIIVDIDGTLANMGDRSPYDWDRVGEDTPNNAILQIVRHLQIFGTKIVICTGRDGVCEEATKKWLDRHCVQFDDFYIRPEGNTEKDDIIKERMLEKIVKKYSVEAVFDDRDQVVRMWRRKGLTCLQVADGNF